MFYGDEDDKEDAADSGSDSAEEVQETKKVLKTNLQVAEANKNKNSVQK